MERAGKGGIGGMKTTPAKIKKNAPLAIEAIIQMLSKGWDPFTINFCKHGRHR